MKHEDYVSFEQAVKLKELGFDWEVNHSYYTIGCKNFHESLPTPAYDPGPTDTAYSNLNELSVCVSAPTLAQAQKWLREVKHIDIDIDSVYHRLDTGNKIMYGLRIGNQSTFKTEFYMNYDSYEEALSKGIDITLKNLK